MRKRKRDPLGFDELLAIVEARTVHPDEVPRILASHGHDYDAAARIGELVAEQQVNQHTDLSPRRRRQLHRAGLGIFMVGYALALKAGED